MTALNLPVLVLGTAVQGRRPNDGNFRALNAREFFINTYDQVLCYLNSAGSMVTFQLNPTLYAMLASPALSGAPTAPTPAAGDNSTRISTTAFVAALVATLSARTAVGSGAYTAQATDRLIAYTALAAASTVTLPAAASYPKGVYLTVVDEGGLASGTLTITLAAAGSDKINGAATYVVSQAYGFVAVECDGSSKWTVIDSSTFPTSALGSNAPAMDGTAASGSASTASRSDHVHPSDTSRAPLASPALTGTPTAPTAAAGTNTGQLATTAFATAADAAVVAALTKRTAVSDAAYTVLATDRLVAVTKLTAARTLTLPSAASYPTGVQLVVVDESGSAGSYAITLAVNGSDTINGAASAAVNTARGYLALESNGATAWTVVDNAVPSAAQVAAGLGYAPARPSSSAQATGSNATNLAVGSPGVLLAQVQFVATASTALVLGSGSFSSSTSGAAENVLCYCTLQNVSAGASVGTGAAQQITVYNNNGAKQGFADYVYTGLNIGQTYAGYFYAYQSDGSYAIATTYPTVTVINF